MNYSSERQLAGLTGVGVIVTLTTVAYLYQLPSTFFPFDGGPFYADWAGLWVVYLGYSLVSLPLDIWAGYVLRARQSVSLPLPVYLRDLLRALLVQGLVMTSSGLLLLLAGKRWGVWGAVAALCIALVAMMLMRPVLARALGSSGADSADRRHYTVAAAWVAAGFLLCASLPWSGVRTLFALLETLLGCTLWSLLGLWILRRFHPDAARASMYLSWASFGLLSRATPALAGRPDRWASAAAD